MRMDLGAFRRSTMGRLHVWCSSISRARLVNQAAKARRGSCTRTKITTAEIICGFLSQFNVAPYRTPATDEKSMSRIRSGSNVWSQFAVLR